MAVSHRGARNRRVGATLSISIALLVAAGCQVMPDTTYTGEATFYTGGSAGNCSFDQDVGVMYGALNATDYEGSRACGAHLEVTGPEGTITVQVVDQCPECAKGDIDLSPEAFDLIADPAAGRVPITWTLVSSPSSGNVQYVVKDGSSQWWMAIQARQHRNLVTKLEVDVDGTWVSLQRESYNYFVAPSGLGVGPFTIRLTDVHGEQLVHTGITLSPTVVQTTASQFTAH
jgi:expansin (peptidoglycan-binding protein)